MDDVRGDVLRPPHCTTPAAVKAHKKIVERKQTGAHSTTTTTTTNKNKNKNMFYNGTRQPPSENAHLIKLLMKNKKLSFVKRCWFKEKKLDYNITVAYVWSVLSIVL